MTVAQTINVDAKAIPIVESVDVVVCGSGPAGIGSALAAARNGARVAIVEREFALGGMMTTGLMSKIAISHTIKGIAWEIISKLEDQKKSYPEGAPEIPIDPEATKLLLDQLLQKEKVSIYLGSVVAGVTLDEGRIQSVLIENKSGRQAVCAKVFIDATGDGDLSWHAQADYEIGREGDGLCSAPTLMFRMCNVDYERLLTYLDENPEDLLGYEVHDTDELRECLYGSPPKYAYFGRFQKLIERVTKEKSFTEWERRVLDQRDGILFFNLPANNQVLVNSTRIPKVTGVDGKELSDAMIEGRKQAWFISRFLKKHLPGMENAFVGDTAAQMGLRESRRIRGEYQLTVDDVLGQARFDDVIVRNTGGVEIHNPNGSGTEFIRLESGEWYDVPLRSAIVKGFKNLFVCGRCFSASHAALSAARSIGFCLGMGQGVGTAAALAKELVDVRDVDVQEVQVRIGY